MRLLSVLRKCVREQKRDLWVLGLSLAFAPMFVSVYWLWTGGATGSTSYGVLIINQDEPVTLTDGRRLAAGEEIFIGLQDMAYENGSPLLRVMPEGDRAEAEKRLRNREAAILVIIPKDFSNALRLYRDGDRTVSTSVTFVGDLSNPTYTIAAVMVMTVADNYINRVTDASRPVELIEISLGSSAARSEFENYVPGVFILSVILLVFQAAMTPARDIESGALRRLRLTRLTTFEYLGGMTVWLSIVALAEMLLAFATAILFGFRSQGQIWVAILTSAITGISIIGIGLIVASFSKTVARAFVIANFPLGFLMFLTGAIYPIPQKPLFTIFGHPFTIPSLLPPTHAVTALNKIFTLGSGLGDVVFELSMLTALSLGYFFVGVWLFQRTQMREGA